VTSGFAPCSGSRHVFENMPELINLGLVRKHNAEPGQSLGRKQSPVGRALKHAPTLSQPLTME